MAKKAGLGSGTKSAKGAPAAGPPSPIWKRPPLLAGAGGVCVVIVVVAVVLSSGGSPAGPDPTIYTEGHNPFLEAPGATCVGMPLGSGSVVYCVDSSSALRDIFDAIRGAVRLSLGTLSLRQQFGLVVCTETEPKVVPLAANNPTNRAAVTELLDSIHPTGRTDVASGVRAAIKLAPHVVCVIAPKGPEPADVDALAAAANGITVHGLAVRDEAPTLSALAEKTGGSHQLIDPQELVIWLGDAQAEQ